MSGGPLVFFSENIVGVHVLGGINDVQGGSYFTKAIFGWIKDIQKERSFKPYDFYSAIRYGDLEAVEDFLHSGANPNEKDSFGVFPILYAVENACMDIWKVLIKYNADPNVVYLKRLHNERCGDIDIIPLDLVSFSIFSNNLEIVKKALHECRNTLKMTDLLMHLNWVLLFSDKLGILQIIWDTGKFDVNDCAYYNMIYQALSSSLTNAPLAFLKFFMQQGFDLNRAFQSGFDHDSRPNLEVVIQEHLILLSIIRNRLDWLEYLLPFWIKSSDIVTETLITLFRYRGSLELIELVCIKMGDVLSQEEWEKVCAQAIRDNHVKAVEFLLTQTIPHLNIHDMNCTRLSKTITALHLCVSPEMMELLVQHGGDVNFKSVDAETPLHWLCGPLNSDIDPTVYNGVVDTIEAMVKYDADIEARDSIGSTPLFFALRCGNLVAIRQLIKLNADVNNVSTVLGDGIFVMAGATSYQNSNQDDVRGVIQLLLDGNCNINEHLDDGHQTFSPLGIAISRINVTLVKSLIQLKADINNCMTENGLQIDAEMMVHVLLKEERADEKIKGNIFQILDFLRSMMQETDCPKF